MKDEIIEISARNNSTKTSHDRKSIKRIIISYIQEHGHAVSLVLMNSLAWMNRNQLYYMVKNHTEHLTIAETHTEEPYAHLLSEKAPNITLSHVSLTIALGIVIGAGMILLANMLLPNRQCMSEYYKTAVKLLSAVFGSFSILLVFVRSFDISPNSFLYTFLCFFVGLHIGICNSVFLNSLSQSYKQDRNKYKKIKETNTAVQIGICTCGVILFFAEYYLPKRGVFSAIFLLSLGSILLSLFMMACLPKGIKKPYLEEINEDTGDSMHSLFSDKDPEDSDERTAQKSTKNQTILKERDILRYWSYALLLLWYISTSFLESVYLSSYKQLTVQKSLFSNSSVLFIIPLIGYITAYYIPCIFYKLRGIKLFIGIDWYFFWIVFMCGSFLLMRNFPNILLFSVYGIGKTISVTSIWIVVPILLGEATSIPIITGGSIIFSAITEYFMNLWIYSTDTTYFSGMAILIMGIIAILVTIPVYIKISTIEDSHIKKILLAERKEKQKNPTHTLFSEDEHDEDENLNPYHNF